MKQLEIISVADSNTLLERVFLDLGNLIAQKLQSQNEFHLGLTGGRFGAALAKQIFMTGFAQNPKVHFWWSDERFLPVGDSDRNDSVVPPELQAANNIHAMPSSEQVSLTEAARIASVELEKLPIQPTNKLMDLTLLSVGPDGHIASLFPNHAALTATNLVIAVADSPKPPKERLTWSIPTLNRSSQVWFLASGPEKLSAVTHLMAGDLSIPASHVSGIESSKLYADKAALLA